MKARDPPRRRNSNTTGWPCQAFGTENNDRLVILSEAKDLLFLAPKGLPGYVANQILRFALRGPSRLRGTSGQAQNDSGGFRTTDGFQHDRGCFSMPGGMLHHDREGGARSPWFSLFLLCHFRPSFVILGHPCHPAPPPCHAERSEGSAVRRLPRRIVPRPGQSRFFAPLSMTERFSMTAGGFSSLVFPGPPLKADSSLRSLRPFEAQGNLRPSSE